MGITAKRLTFIALLCCVFAPVLGWAQKTETKAYDELYDQKGNLRPQYRPIKEYIYNTTRAEQKRFRIYSTKRFRNDNALSDIPKILTREESDRLQKGVEQRGRAILMLLRDHYSGKKSYTAVIPRHVMNRIIDRYDEQVYADMLNNIDNFMMFYGPDLVRNAKGEFVALEDNVGFIGGVGDLKLSYDLILEKHPVLTRHASFTNPMKFYAEMVQMFRNEAALKGGKAVFYMNTPYVDQENVRMKEIFQSLGLEVVTNRSEVRLIFEKDGVFTQKKSGGPREKVGFIGIMDEYQDLDFTLPANLTRMTIYAAKQLAFNREIFHTEISDNERRQLRSILEEINPQTGLPDIDKLKEILSQYYNIAGDKVALSGITQAVLSGQVGASAVPGTEFVSDKEFYTYVDDLIEFYLKEEPIIKNLQTLRMARADGSLNLAVLNRVMSSKDDWVIKNVSGRGGDSVWVGRNLSQEKFKAVAQRIRKDPESFQAQQYVSPSTIMGNITDLRPIAMISERQTLVGPPWGRHVDPRKTNGLMNVSMGGAVTPVLIETDGCEALLESTAH